MSLLAGIFSRVPGREPPPAACEAMRRALSRAPGDEPSVHRFSGCWMARLDVGALEGPGEHADADGAVTLLAGEPLLGDGSAGPAADLARLHDALRRGAAEVLREAHGVFALAQHDPAAGTLRLASDALGVRPLYSWVGEEWVVFASALRVLEDCALVPRVMDVRGAAEAAGIGIPLGRRTVYAGVERIGAAEVREVGPGGVARRTYRRWDVPEAEPLSGHALAEAVDVRFRAAVRRRLRGDRATLAFLSGGMDSRAVVASLREAGAAVHTFNFSLPGMQDHALSAAFAERAGTLHLHHPMRMELQGAKFALTLRDAWAVSPHREACPPERPALAWSGDGGSVGLGHVYVTPEVVRLARAGRPAAAADAFLASVGLGIPRRIVRRGGGDALLEAPRAGVVEEMEALDSPDRGRAFHLFLMLNDQRRHLGAHFEHLDLHRVELHLPFFDPELLATVVAAPLDECVQHRLYARWFDLLPAPVREVPWQTYPGHVPCPLPVPEGLGWQWDRRAFAGLRAGRRRQLLGEARALLRSPRFPTPFLRRLPVAAAAAVYATGWRDYSYVLRAAAELHRAYDACGGRYAAPAG